MKTKIYLASLIAMVICSCGLNGQSFNKVKADSLLNLLVEKNKAMGSLAVLENGNVVYSRAIGFIESTPEKISATEMTRYRIGSISKMFTATLIFQLIDEGKLELSTKLDRFFPAVPNAKKITIGTLLSHSTRLAGYNAQQRIRQPTTMEGTDAANTYLHPFLNF